MLTWSRGSSSSLGLGSAPFLAATLEWYIVRGVAPWSDPFELVCWAVMLAVATAASVTDLRRGRIPNRLVVGGLVVALVVHLASFALNVAGGAEPAGAAAARLGGPALNAAVGLATGLALYLAGLWSAGDAKLVVALAFAQPTWVSLTGPVPWAPVLVVLANALVAALVFIALEGLVRGAPPLARALRARTFALDFGRREAPAATVARIALAMAALAAALGPFRSWLAGRADGYVSGGPFLVYLVLFAAYRPLKAVALRRGGLAAAAVLLAAATAHALWSRGGEGALGIGRSLLIAAAVMATRGLLALSSWSFDSRALAVDELRPGMVLAPRYIETLEADARWAEAFAPILGDLRGFVLDQNYIDNIREWHTHNARGAPVRIHAPLPFAPALAVGVVLTALLKGLAFRF